MLRYYSANHYELFSNAIDIIFVTNTRVKTACLTYMFYVQLMTSQWFADDVTMTRSWWYQHVKDISDMKSLAPLFALLTASSLHYICCWLTRMSIYSTSVFLWGMFGYLSPDNVQWHDITRLRWCMGLFPVETSTTINPHKGKYILLYAVTRSAGKSTCTVAIF